MSKTVPSVKIVGLGKYLPKKVVTNFDLEEMVDTSDEWIVTRTGIRERRIVSDQSASTLGSQASRKALRCAGIRPKDVDLIIVATITPDTQFPSTACYIQRDLGAKKAAVLDVSAACAGFVYALGIAQALVGGGFYKNALVVGSEVLTTITDWKDRSTCILFGDGAGAAVVVPTRSSGGVISMYLGGDGNFSDLLILLIPHQANLRIIKAVGKRLGLADEKIFVNIHKYGNMSSASTAVALCEAYEQGQIKKGSIVVLDAFGGGLVWGSSVIRWI
jgi:3-oxoacyl-[acyl-carrier-protein] synthase-3